MRADRRSNIQWEKIMPIVRFIGRVSPKTVKIDARMPELRWKWDEAALELLIRIVVAGSHRSEEHTSELQSLA